MEALKISTESFFQLKYLQFIRNTVQIIALLHDIWFIIYKLLLSNAQRFKGPSWRKFHPLSTKTEFKCRTIKVNLSTRWRWVTELHALAALCLGRTLEHIEQEAGWAAEPVWTFWRTEKPLATTGIWTADCPVRSLVIYWLHYPGS
jgi:hypothetical protein